MNKKLANQNGKSNDEAKKVLWFVPTKIDLEMLVKGPWVYITACFVGSAVLATMTMASLGLGWCVFWTLFVYSAGYLTQPKPTENAEVRGMYILCAAATLTGVLASFVLLVLTLIK